MGPDSWYSYLVAFIFFLQTIVFSVIYFRKENEITKMLDLIQDLSAKIVSKDGADYFLFTNKQINRDEVSQDKKVSRLTDPTLGKFIGGPNVSKKN